MLLHAAILVWFSLPEIAPLPALSKPLRISLLATIAEKNVEALSTVAKKIIETKPEVQPKKPKPILPVVSNKPTPKPQPILKPTPVEKVQEVAQATPNDAKPAKIDVAATARYESLLVAWLEKFKKYPLRAKRLRIEGEGRLLIRIDRSGQTMHVSLAERTGSRLLDKAALEMVKRANPFPSMAQNDPRLSLEFIVPVAFLLR